MNKTDLVKEIARRVDKPIAEVGQIINCFMDVVGDKLQEGEKVSLIGFGTFETKESAERIGKNPRNPEEQIIIPAKTRPSFKASQKLKDKVNDK